MVNKSFESMENELSKSEKSYEATFYHFKDAIDRRNDKRREEEWEKGKRDRLIQRIAWCGVIGLGAVAAFVFYSTAYGMFA